MAALQITAPSYEKPNARSSERRIRNGKALLKCNAKLMHCVRNGRTAKSTELCMEMQCETNA